MLALYQIEDDDDDEQSTEGTQQQGYGTASAQAGDGLAFRPASSAEPAPSESAYVPQPHLKMASSSSKVSPSSTHPGGRQKSCEACRKSKSKCDRVVDGCSYCRLHGIPCVYTGARPVPSRASSHHAPDDPRIKQEVAYLRRRAGDLIAELGGMSASECTDLWMQVEIVYASRREGRVQAQGFSVDLAARPSVVSSARRSSGSSGRSQSPLPSVASYTRYQYVDQSPPAVARPSYVHQEREAVAISPPYPTPLSSVPGHSLYSHSLHYHTSYSNSRSLVGEMYASSSTSAMEVPYQPRSDAVLPRLLPNFDHLMYRNGPVSTVNCLTPEQDISKSGQPIERSLDSTPRRPTLPPIRTNFASFLPPPQSRRFDSLLESTDCPRPLYHSCPALSAKEPAPKRQKMEEGSR